MILGISLLMGRPALSDDTPSLKQVVFLVSEGQPVDAQTAVEAISSQMSDLPVSFSTLELSTGEVSDERLEALALRSVASGARVVIWLNRETPEYVFFLTSGPNGNERFRRLFDSGTSPATHLENLAQICRATVQVLIDAAPTPSPPKSAASNSRRVSH